MNLIDSLIAEIERLESQNRALVEAAQAISDKIANDFTLTKDSAGVNAIGITFSRQEIDALRAALEANR